MSDQAPVYTASRPATLGKTAEEIAISMLLTPPGHVISYGDSFTQAELDSLEAFVLNKIITYCNTHIPRDSDEHEDHVKLYSEICEGFSLVSTVPFFILLNCSLLNTFVTFFVLFIPSHFQINTHSFNTANHSGVPQGNSCGQTGK
jgi:hypothetical protein